jgi:hypothetical protein
MLKRLMEALNLDADGSVRRTEFDPLPQPEVLLSPNEREAVESFVLDVTSSAFRYMDRSGKEGIVFYDDRGRAAAGIIRDMDDGLLLALAKREGYEYVPSA